MLGKIKEIADEMKKYNLDLIGIQEIRWQGKGMIEKRISASCSADQKTLVRRVVMYAVETWTLLNSDIHYLNLKEEF